MYFSSNGRERKEEICIGVFYLERVIAIIENCGYRDAMEKLAGTLQEQGMLLQCYWIAELGLEEATAEAVFDGIWEAHERAAEETGGKKHAQAEDAAPEKESPGEESAATLWMTDAAEILKVLRQEEQPVLALLHENNRSQDFSAALYVCEEPGEADADYLDKVYRRYKRLPWEILQTARCLIRETTPKDAEAFYEIYREPSVTQYTEDLFPEIAQEKKYINAYIDNVYSFYNLGVWTIMKRDTGEIIGRAGLSYREGFEEPELGFVIGRPWQRQGYAEEVCRAILEYGRDELEFTVVQAFVRPENAASLGLCRKLGMRLAGEVDIQGIKHCRMIKDK